MARSIKYAPGTPLYVADRPGRREPAEVVSDSGLGPLEVRIVATGELEMVELRDVQARRVAPGPPPGVGGRDVPPLRFGTKAEPGPDYVPERKTSPAEMRQQMQLEARPRVMAQLRAQPKPAAPFRDPEHLAWVRSLPCAHCTTAPPSEAAHYGPRGVGQKTDDQRTLPLCRPCHRSLDETNTIGMRGLDETRAWVSAAIVSVLAVRVRLLGAQLEAAKRQVGLLLARATTDGGG